MRITRLSSLKSKRACDRRNNQFTHSHYWMLKMERLSCHRRQPINSQPNQSLSHRKNHQVYLAGSRRNSNHRPRQNPRNLCYCHAPKSSICSMPTTAFTTLTSLTCTDTTQLTKAETAIKKYFKKSMVSLWIQISFLWRAPTTRSW